GAQRIDTAVVGKTVPDFHGCLRLVRRSRSIDYTVDNDVIHRQTLGVEQTHDVMPARTVSAHVADDDVMNTRKSTLVFSTGANHSRVRAACLTVGVKNGR